MKRARILAFLMSLILLMSLAAPAVAAAASEAETVGLAYYRGTNGEQNYEKALEYMQKADQEGSTEVLYPLGDMYEKGLGTIQSYTTAVRYYLRASDAGNELATEKLKQQPIKNVVALVKVNSQATHLITESGDVEGVRGPTYPYYLANPLVNAKSLSLILSVDQQSGYPFGYFYLYVKDSKGNWHHTSLFKIEKSMADGHYETFDLKFDQTESDIVALAICPEEKGMDFVASFDAYFIANEENVGEYSSSIPKPVYTPARDEHPVASVHQVTAPYNGGGGGGCGAVSICPDTFLNYLCG